MDTSGNDGKNEAASNDRRCTGIDKGIISTEISTITQTVTGQPRAHTCSSTLSKAAEVVLGLTAEVVRFDKARNKVKQHPQNKSFSEEYMTILAIIHTRISQQRQILKEEISTWEKGYFATSGGQIPTYDKMMKNPSIEQVFKRLKYADVLLKKFKGCKI